MNCTRNHIQVQNGKNNPRSNKKIYKVYACLYQTCFGMIQEPHSQTKMVLQNNNNKPEHPDVAPTSPKISSVVFIRPTLFRKSGKRVPLFYCNHTNLI